MTVQRLPITSREEWLAWRREDVTASVAACLFGNGVHPCMTTFELWARKSGLTPEDDEDTPAKRRGRLLEPIALTMLTEDRPGWRIHPSRFYYRDAASRIGATPDAIGLRHDIAGLGVVQIKTVGPHAFRKGWRNEFGEIEPPLWIGIQATVEAALADARWAAIAAMEIGDGGLEMHVVDVPLHAGLMDRLRVRVREFWRMVETKTICEPDFGRDGATIARLYADDDGGEIDLSADERIATLVAERDTLRGLEAEGASAEKQRRAIDAELIFKLGNAQRARLGDGRMLEAKTVRRAGYEVKECSYRQVRIR